jgi:hypothetical protein
MRISKEKISLRIEEVTYLTYFIFLVRHAKRNTLNTDNFGLV